MPQQLIDRVIILTGASSGIGAATARACAAAGMHVLLTARRGDRLSDLQQELESTGRRALVVPGDAADPRLPERLLDAAEAEWGGFYAVLANAGYGEQVAMSDMRENALREMFEVNFFAATRLLQAAAQRLLERGQRGHLLMTSSCVARLTLPENGAYCATKAAQHHVCRAMNMELKRRGIRVTSVHPIGTKTEFFDPRPDRPRAAAFKRPPAMFIQSPERVARAIVGCLRRPRPEVWTSFSFRVIAALMTIFPRAMDIVAREESSAQR